MSSPASSPRAWERGRSRSRSLFWTLILAACQSSAAAAPAAADPPREPGLLFHLSGTRGTEADVAAPGTRRPNFEHGIAPVADGARGPGLSCSHTQVLSYWAPGNIYAERGTLAFFWRAREPVGPTEFPIFRVGFGDHSSWDMVWSRIDYNGHGFDAFVTDANLARRRVSVTVAPFPPPERWVHLALAWDETRGIRFFVGGRLVAVQDGQALLDTALDQLGPHSRIIAPLNVQSDYNFVRGGDIDEVRVYDRVLDDADVAALARGQPPRALPALPPRNVMVDARVRNQWWWRYGWNRPGDPPPYLTAPATRIRKVEIHDAYDLGRWWWKANDGIPETTWPGVYNRSSLPGRRDYFVLPDWDCYSTSGRAVTFALPSEPWNAIQITGAAWGKLRLLSGTGPAPPSAADAGPVLFERPAGQQRTFHQLATPVTGQAIRFESAAPEQPIAELGAFLVTPGAAPAGAHTLRYRLAHPGPSLPAELVSLGGYIDGRHPFDERARLVAEPAPPEDVAGGAAAAKLARAAADLQRTAPDTEGLPLVHILIPPKAATRGYDWSTFEDGLDGIVIDLPALGGRPTHGDLLPLNVRVKDPLWPMRDLLEFSFSVKPGEARTLWLDLRDRLLPPGRGLYLTVAAAGGGFDAQALTGATLALVFKDRAAARPEHELDRFTQVRDVYAMMVEEHPADPRFNLWNRFKGDLDDLLRVNPDHLLGRQYAVAAGVPGIEAPPVSIPEPPPGVPRWAFRQVTALAGVERLVLWYIQHRQIADGELGGGLSDDSDLTNLWPGAALMGCQPERLAASQRAVLEACYGSGMLVGGLPAIQMDELHGYEEGINALGQALLLDYGSPQLLERAMETTRAVTGLTGVNRAGHRHFRTAYYSATRVAEDSVWGYDKPFMTLLLHPALLLGDFNGNPSARRLVRELADGLLPHRQRDDAGRTGLPRAIHFATDRDTSEGRSYFPWPVFWAAWRWTGAAKYLDPITDGGLSAIMAVNGDLLDEVGVREQWRPRILAGENAPPTERRASGDVRRRGGGGGGDNNRRSTAAHFAWQLSGDKHLLDELYGKVIQQIARREFINTEGSIWIDRVDVPHADLQRARLGGVALVRNGTYPGHLVSWAFEAPASAESVAILIPRATPRAFEVVAYNLETRPVRATMTTWNVEPGRWEIVRGLDSNDDDAPDRDLTRTVVDVERGGGLPLTLPARATTVLRLRLLERGVPYDARPDLGIGRADVTGDGGRLTVRVHSLGAVPAAATRVVFRDHAGRVRAAAPLPELPAPLDLLPRTADVALALPAGVVTRGGSIEVDPESRLHEITRRNNIVRM